MLFAQAGMEPFLYFQLRERDSSEGSQLISLKSMNGHQ